MSREQTTVEWLHKHLTQLMVTREWRSKDLHIEKFHEAFLTASAMERQQIMDAFDDGVDACYLEVDELGMRMVTPDELGGLDYYEKKYETNE